MNLKKVILSDASIEAKVSAIAILLDKELPKLTDKVDTVKKLKGEQGERGIKGDKGDVGKDAKDGKNGKDGKDGKDGKNGKDGDDGVSVTDAKVDFDDSLVFTLSNGKELNVGEIKGEKGDSGRDGNTGSNGIGVPTGGTTGQALVKNSGSDYDTKWSTIGGGGSGTVTSVAALTLGTTGTNLSSTVATGTTTPVITLNVPTASASNRGALSSTDWTTFNSKGSGSVTSVSGTGTVNGITLTGTVTSSGNLTLGGTLDLSSPPIIGGTAPNTGNFSTVNLSAGTTTVAPLDFVTGTNLTTPAAGAWEYDGTAFYATPIASNRAVNVAEHFVARTGTKTMTSNTALQSIFDNTTGTGGLTSGALTVGASTSYFFEMSINVNTMSATSGNMGFSIVGAGTATFTSAAWHAFGLDNTNQQTGANAGTTWQSTAGATGNIITAAVGTSASAIVKGIFRINGAGTIIPSIQLTTASAAVIGVNTWFKCYPVGTNTVISVGNWA